MNQDDTREDNLHVDIHLDKSGDPDPNNYKFKNDPMSNDGMAVESQEIKVSTPKDITASPNTKDTDKEPNVCAVAYWQMLFMIDNKEFGTRIANSMNVFWAQKFVDQIRKQVDLYGPTWIPSTVVFLSIISSSFSNIFVRLFVDKEKVIAHEYNFSNLGLIFFLIYGVLFIFPCVMTIIFKCTHTEGPTNLQVIYI